MLMSPSMSLVIAGVASGICFLIYTNIIKGKSGEPRQADKEIPVDNDRCSCCLRPFFLSHGVRCKDCGARSCRKACSRWDPSDNAWHCLFCRQQRYWLTKTESEVFGGPIDEKELHSHLNTAKSQVYAAGVENATTSSSAQGLAAEKEEANTMETVRDFVERIIDGLIGNASDAPINRLYDHSTYDTNVKEHVALLVDALTRLATVLQISLNNKPGTDSPTMAHTALREVVERVVEEARKLPSLAGSGGTGKVHETRSNAEHSYEDILATAILNKVIEKFQKEQVDGNSNVLPGKSPSATKYPLSESETGLDEGVEEGCSSLEPSSQDDCSSECSARAAYSKRVRRSQPEPLSLTIEERIEEVTTYTSEEDPKATDVLGIRNAYRVPFPELGMDIIDPSQESEDSQDEPDTPTTHIGLVSPIESWEENWLFQRKRVPTQADPVNMLVPNPGADYKALIGDKDAEDTSDLSECSAQSDEEIEKELMEAINNVVPRSPKILQNGLNHRSIDSKENYIETLSEAERKCGSKIEDQSETKRKEENGETRVESVMENETIGTKGVEEKKSERVETEAGKPVPEPIDVIGNDPSNGEMEQRAKNEKDKPEEDETRNLIEDSYSVKLAPESKEKNEAVSNSTTSLISLEPSVEENGSDVPKTPTSTPTGPLPAKNSMGDTNEEGIVASNGGDVLSSLECAKKKLMDDCTGEVFENEESRSSRQKLDFHAEDIQQESEYTEHYDTATQRHLDSLTKTETSESSPPPVDSPEENEKSRCREAVALAKAESASHLFPENKDTEGEVQLATPPKPGTIAEREHRKWENAPPIENNPYSQENIQKRLWERQYSRRSSDIPGMHPELQKSNGDDLDAMLAPHEPDIKRFGRDYYINDSRTSGNEKGRRSAASTSSRPSSSLSQRSSSTGIAEDQQVSFQLEMFEEASLRGSLSRQALRDPYSTPHFAVNPLLRMELDTTSDYATDPIHENSIGLAEEQKSSIIEKSLLDDARCIEIERRVDRIKLNDPHELKIAYNPVYEPEGNILKPDRDSGLYSVDTNDEQEHWKRLWINDWQSDVKNDQIFSFNGRKYCNFNGYKYNTFGGIKNSLTHDVEDSDEDNSKDVSSEPFDTAEFTRLNFQAFGGIKKSSKKIDGKGIPTYRRITLRSSFQSSKSAKVLRTSQSAPILQHVNGANKISDKNFDDDEQINYFENSYETFDHTDKQPLIYESSSDDDWQDEDIRVPDKMIMRKFLKDASKKWKSRSNSDNDSTYFLNTSRRKVFDDNPKRTKSQKHRSLDDNESLKLEPPIVPEVVAKTFETLRDLRVKGKKKKHKPEPVSNKKLGVRTLSDLTIW